jgi:hypothetical protein
MWNSGSITAEKAANAEIQDQNRSVRDEFN